MRLSRLSLLVLTACGSGPGPSGDTAEVEKSEFSCALGPLEEGTAFTAFAADEPAEMLLGFQGFLFVQTRIQAEKAPASCLAVSSIAISGEVPNGSNQPEVGFISGPDGHLSDAIPIFLPTANLSAYVGRTATLAVRLEGPREYCIATAEVTLVDDDKCVHAGGDEACGDTGTP